MYISYVGSHREISTSISSLSAKISLLITIITLFLRCGFGCGCDCARWAQGFYNCKLCSIQFRSPKQLEMHEGGAWQPHGRSSGRPPHECGRQRLHIHGAGNPHTIGGIYSGQYRVITLREGLILYCPEYTRCERAKRPHHHTPTPATGTNIGFVACNTHSRNGTTQSDEQAGL